MDKRGLMVIDRTLLDEYPFTGSFYTYKMNENVPLNERTEQESLVLETECDIQGASKSQAGGNLTESFNVYFPFDKDTNVKVQRGMTFKGSMYGINIVGIVENVFPSQLGGVACTIKDIEVNDK